MSGSSRPPTPLRESNASAGAGSSNLHLNPAFPGRPQPPPAAPTPNADPYNLPGAPPPASLILHHHVMNVQTPGMPATGCSSMASQCQQPGMPEQRPAAPSRTRMCRLSDTQGVINRWMSAYDHCLNRRPKDNDISFWKMFVRTFYETRSKERWCLSSCNVPVDRIPGATVPWFCALCGSRSGKRIESTSEALPRLFKIKFDSGILSEELTLGTYSLWRLPSGRTAAEYDAAVHHTVYRNLSVIRKGRLLVIFSSRMKILNWLFCGHHEVVLSPEVVVPQVNRILQTAEKAKKHQTAVRTRGLHGASDDPELQACIGRLLSLSKPELVKRLEPDFLNELGFPVPYVRMLQTYATMNIMTELVDFSSQRHMGPIESLNNYPAYVSAQPEFNMDASIPTDPRTQIAIRATKNHQNFMGTSTSTDQPTDDLNRSTVSPNPSDNMSGPLEPRPLFDDDLIDIVECLLKNSSNSELMMQSFGSRAETDGR